MLTILCWRWGQKYGPKYVNRLKAGVARNLKQKHRFVCVTNEPEDVSCETIPLEDTGLLSVRDGCYARLRQFDPEWQAKHGIDKLVCLDLDLIVTGELDPLFDRSEPFMILHGGHYQPCPFNGSVQMLKRGFQSKIWSDFDVFKADKIAMQDGTHRGTDQTWIAHVAPDAPGWTFKDGIYGYRKPGWPQGRFDLPRDARIVAFPGVKDPSRAVHLDWVKRHWL